MRLARFDALRFFSIVLSLSLLAILCPCLSLVSVCEERGAAQGAATVSAGGALARAENDFRLPLLLPASLASPERQLGAQRCRTIGSLRDQSNAKRRVRRRGRAGRGSAVPCARAPRPAARQPAQPITTAPAPAAAAPPLHLLAPPRPRTVRDCNDQSAALVLPTAVTARQSTLWARAGRAGSSAQGPDHLASRIAAHGVHHTSPHLRGVAWRPQRYQRTTCARPARPGAAHSGGDGGGERFPRSNPFLMDCL